MPEDASVGRQKRTKKRKISKEGWTVKPYTDNASEIMRIIKASGGRIERATLLRELVSEALTARRLGQIGIDESLSGVKSAQREVVSEEVEEIKKLLADLLALARGHGTLLDTISGQGREAAGLLFHVLRTVFNIEELSQDFLARPALEGAGKDEEAITETFSEAESEWTKETLNVIESVRNQVNSATV